MAARGRGLITNTFLWNLWLEFKITWLINLDEFQQTSLKEFDPLKT